MLFEADCWYVLQGSHSSTHCCSLDLWNQTCVLLKSSPRRHNKGWAMRGPGRPGVSRDAEGLWALPEGSAVLGHCQHHVRLLLPLPPGSLWSAQTCVACFSSVPCSGSQQALVFGSVAPAPLCLSSFNCKSCKIL